MTLEDAEELMGMADSGDGTVDLEALA